jgi:hypothetical protein
MRSEGTPSIATGTGPTSRGRLADRRTVWPRACVCCRSRIELQRLRLYVWCHCRRGLGDVPSHQSRRGQHEPGRRRILRARPPYAVRSPPRHVFDRCRQREYQRRELLSSKGRRSDHGGIEHPNRLRDRRSRISGASSTSMRRFVHPLRVSYEPYRQRDAERHVDGGAARRGGCSADSAKLARRFTGDGAE